MQVPRPIRSKSLGIGPRTLGVSFVLFLFLFCFFGYAAWLAESQFPDRGLNPATALKAQNPNH